MILACRAPRGHAALLDNRDSQVILALWVISALLVGQVPQVIQGQRGQLAQRAQQVLRVIPAQQGIQGLLALLVSRAPLV